MNWRTAGRQVRFALKVLPFRLVSERRYAALGSQTHNPPLVGKRSSKFFRSVYRLPRAGPLERGHAGSRPAPGLMRSMTAAMPQDPKTERRRKGGVLNGRGCATRQKRVTAGPMIPHVTGTVRRRRSSIGAQVAGRGQFLRGSSAIASPLMLCRHQRLARRQWRSRHGLAPYLSARRGRRRT